MRSRKSTSSAPKQQTLTQGDNLSSQLNSSSLKTSRSCFKNSVEIKRGFLMKRNPWFINQKRLFILTNQPRLMYFKDENTFRGEIMLSKDTIVKKICKFKFEITTKNRTYYLRHPDKGSIDSWVQSINDAGKEM